MWILKKLVRSFQHPKTRGNSETYSAYAVHSHSLTSVPSADRKVVFLFLGPCKGSPKVSQMSFSWHILSIDSLFLDYTWQRLSSLCITGWRSATKSLIFTTIAFSYSLAMSSSSSLSSWSVGWSVADLSFLACLEKKFAICLGVSHSSGENSMFPLTFLTNCISRATCAGSAFIPLSCRRPTSSLATVELLATTKCFFSVFLIPNPSWWCYTNWIWRRGCWNHCIDLDGWWHDIQVTFSAHFFLIRSYDDFFF